MWWVRSQAGLSDISASGARSRRALTFHSSTRIAAATLGPSSVLLVRISPSVRMVNMPSGLGRPAKIFASSLLLDDPTAAIDSETEHEIFEALDRAIAGRTTFIVAHRLSTLRRADFIIVMDDGRIVQQGTHQELMNVPGPYLRVARLQLIDSRELEQFAPAKGTA